MLIEHIYKESITINNESLFLLQRVLNKLSVLEIYWWFFSQ